MSRYEWESGTIVLPSAEFARVRQAVQAADDKVERAAFEHTQTFWKGLTAKQRRDPAAYEQAKDEYLRRAFPSGRWEDNRRAGVWERTDEALRLGARYTYDRATNTRKPEYTPKRVLASDMRFPTNKTTHFRARYGASITFDRDKRTVTWTVEENNHAVGYARDTPQAGALFEALKQVKWTGRNTGGVICGNDEYSRDADYSGGGANYDVEGFGPIGVAQAPMVTPGYDTPQGRVKVEVRAGRYGLKGKAVKVGGPQGRVPAGVRTGGQFASRYHGEQAPL